MRALFRLIFLAVFVLLCGVIYIRFVYCCSWKESLQIADQFIKDLVSG